MINYSLAQKIAELNTLDDLRRFRIYLNHRMFNAKSDAEVKKIYAKINAVDKKISKLGG